jgi:large subunit ribosomal protein L10
MTPERTNPIPEYKKKLVEELVNLIKSKKTVLLASVRNVPGSQYQQIVKKIRDKAIVKLPKKNLFFRAVEESKNIELKKLEGSFKDSTAVLFSDSDSFDLASDLLQNKTPSKAKVGQIAPEDIHIEAGPTDLPPGPAISELGAVGLQVEIKDGKISIKEGKVIVKKGESISQAACDIMSKLGISPFTIGFLPLSAYDAIEKKFYENIEIDQEGTLEELKNLYSKTLAFAVKIGYFSSETIRFILLKASSHERAINSLVEKADSNSPKEENSEVEGK